MLRERGVHAVAYHAGMAGHEREAVQEAFMEDGADVIVGTIAFGMGIDKSNVRFVFHYDISDSVDSYYQEIGRAGRDGKPAKAVLFLPPRGSRHPALLRRHRLGGRGRRRAGRRSSRRAGRSRRSRRAGRGDGAFAVEARECPAPCGFCDNCEAGAVAEAGDEPFALGSRVADDSWGEGLVQRYERDKMVVLFDVGYKTLDVGLVTERRLLEPAD